MQCLVGYILEILGACHVQCLVVGYMLVTVSGMSCVGSCCWVYVSNCKACHMQCLVVGYVVLIVGACHVQCLVVGYVVLIVGACHSMVLLLGICY